MTSTNPDLLVPIQRTSYEYNHEILPAVVRNFVNPLSQAHFLFGEAHVIHNQTLLSEYLQKRKELRQAGYKDREVCDSFAFSHCSSEHEVSKICSEGMFIGNCSASALGHPNMGVQLSRHSDILEPNAFSHGQQGNLVVFKIIKGRVKMLLKKCGTQMLEPTPNCDSHMMKLSKTVPSQCSLKEMFELMQVYAYEYGDLEMAQRPRQILPFAVVKFTYVVSKIPIPLLSLDANIPSLESNEGLMLPKQAEKQPGVIVWKGYIIRKTSVCGVELVSSYNIRLPAALKQSLEAIAELPGHQVKNMFLSGVTALPADKETSTGVFYNVCQVRSTGGRERTLQDFADSHKQCNAGSIFELSDGCILIVLPDAKVAVDLGLTLTDDSIYKMHGIIVSKLSCCVEENTTPKLPTSGSPETFTDDSSSSVPPMRSSNVLSPPLSAVSPSHDAILMTSQSGNSTKTDCDPHLRKLTPSNTIGPSSRDPVLIEKCINIDTKTHSRSSISVPSKSASEFVDLTLRPEQHTIPVSTSLHESSCQLQSSASSETSTVSPSSVSSCHSFRSPSPLVLPSFTTNFQAPIVGTESGISLLKSLPSSKANSPGTVHVGSPLETQVNDEIMSIIKMVPRSGVGAIIPVQGQGNVTAIPTNMKRNIGLTDPRLRRLKKADVAESFEQKPVLSAKNYHNFTKLVTKRQLSNENEGKPISAIDVQSPSEQSVTNCGQSIDFRSTAPPKQCSLEMKSNMSGLYKDLLYAGRSMENTDIKDCKASSSAKMPIHGINNPAPRKSPQGHSVEPYTNCVDVKESPAALNEIYNNVRTLHQAEVLCTDTGSPTVLVKTVTSSQDNNGLSSGETDGISSANEMKQFLNQRLDKKNAKLFSPDTLSLGENYLQKETRFKMVSTKGSLEKRNQNTSKGIALNGGADRTKTGSTAWNDRMLVMKASDKANTPSRRWSTDACQSASSTTSIVGGYQVVTSSPKIQSVNESRPRAMSTPLVKMSEVDKPAALSGTRCNIAEEAVPVLLISSHNQELTTNETTSIGNQSPFIIENTSQDNKRLDLKCHDSVEDNYPSPEDECPCSVPACSSPKMDSPLRPSCDNCIVAPQEEYMCDNSSDRSVQELKTNFQHRHKILHFLINCAVQNDFFRGDSECHKGHVLQNYIVQRGNRLDQMTVTFPNEMSRKDKDGDQMTSTTSNKSGFLMSMNCYEQSSFAANQSEFRPYCMKCRDRVSCIDQNGTADVIQGKSPMAGEVNLLQAVISALHRSPVRTIKPSDDVCNGFIREESDCSFDTNIAPVSCNKLSDLFDKLKRSCTSDSKFVQTDISNISDNELHNIEHRKTGALDGSGCMLESDNNREELSLRNTAHPCSEKSWLNACTDIDEMLAVYDIDPTMDNFTNESDNHMKRELLLEKITPEIENTATIDSILETRIRLPVMENQMPNAVNMEDNTNAVNMEVSTSQIEDLVKNVTSKDIREADGETHASPVVLKEMPDSDLEDVHPEENIVSLTDDEKCVAPLSMSVLQSENDMKNVTPHYNKIETKIESHVTQLQTDFLPNNKTMLPLTLNDLAQVVPERTIMDTDRANVSREPNENDVGTTQHDALHTARDKDIEHDSEIEVNSGKIDKSSFEMNFPEHHPDADASTCLNVRDKVTGAQDTNHSQIPIQSDDTKNASVIPTANSSLSSKPRLIEHSAYGEAITAVDVGDAPPSNRTSIVVGVQTVTHDSTQGKVQYMDMVGDALPVNVHLKGTNDEKGDRIKKSVPGNFESKCTTTECKNMLTICRKTPQTCQKRVHAVGGRMHPYQRPKISAAASVTMTPFRNLQELLQNHTKKLFITAGVRGASADTTHEGRGRFHDWKRNKAKKTILLRDGIPVQRKFLQKSQPGQIRQIEHESGNVKRKATSPSPGCPRPVKRNRRLATKHQDTDVHRDLDEDGSRAVHKRLGNSSEYPTSTSESSPQSTGDVNQVSPIMLGTRNHPSKDASGCQVHINAFVPVIQNEMKTSTEGKIDTALEGKMDISITEEVLVYGRNDDSSKDYIASRAGPEKEGIFISLDEGCGYRTSRAVNNVISLDEGCGYRTSRAVNNLEKMIMMREKCSPCDVQESKDGDRRLSTSSECQDEQGSFMRKDSFSGFLKVEERDISIFANNANDPMVHAEETTSNSCANIFQKQDDNIVNKARLDSLSESKLPDHTQNSPSVKSLERDHSFKDENQIDINATRELGKNGLIDMKKQELLEILDNIKKHKLATNTLEHQKFLADGHLEYSASTMLKSNSEECREENFGKTAEKTDSMPARHVANSLDGRSSQDEVDQSNISFEVDVVVENFYEEINPLLDMVDKLDSDGHAVVRLDSVNSNEFDKGSPQEDRKSGFNVIEEMQLMELIEMKKKELQCNTKRLSEIGSKELELDENIDKSPQKASPGIDVMSVHDFSSHKPLLNNMGSSQENTICGGGSAVSISHGQVDLQQATVKNKSQFDKQNIPQHNSGAKLHRWDNTFMPMSEMADSRTKECTMKLNDWLMIDAEESVRSHPEIDTSSDVSKRIVFPIGLNPPPKVDQRADVHNDSFEEAVTELKMKYINALKFGMTELMKTCAHKSKTFAESDSRQIVKYNAADYDKTITCNKMKEGRKNSRDYEDNTVENGCDRIPSVRCLVIDSDSLLNGNADDLRQILQYLQNKNKKGRQWKVWVHAADIKKLYDCSILLPGLDLHWQPHQTMKVLGEFMTSGLVTSMQPHHCDENPLGVTDYLQCRQALKASSGSARALRVLVDVLPSKLDKRIYGQVEFVRMKTFVTYLNRY